MSPIWPAGLLATAERLAGTSSGPGRPALGDLRRATSTAYYALFHQLVRDGSFDFLPGATEEDAAKIARWYSHTGVLAAAGLVVDAASGKNLDQIKKPNITSVTVLRSSAGGEINPRLVAVAEAFQSLQQARHSADYDGNYDPVRAVTLQHVEDCQTALDACLWLWQSGELRRRDESREAANRSYRVFLRLALLNSGGPRAR